jgi:hypothetical protein
MSGPKEEAIDLAAFNNLVVSYKEGAPVRLRDVAVVEDGLEDRRRIARAMGEPSIGFGIQKLRGSNAVEVGRGVRAKLAEVEKQLPQGLSLSVNYDTTTFIEESINEILFTLFLAAVLTGVVCWLFLGSWSSTVNVILAIPTSILGTFIVMYFFDFTLNTFTVLGLTLVVGIVVDDAIMVLENIYRHRERGEGKVKAASVEAREITFTAAATHSHRGNPSGRVPEEDRQQFFFQFGVTISLPYSCVRQAFPAPMRGVSWRWAGRRLGHGGPAFADSPRYLQARRLSPSPLMLAAVVCSSPRWYRRALRQEVHARQDTGRFGVHVPPSGNIDVTDRAFRNEVGPAVSRPFMGFVSGFGGGSTLTVFVMKRPQGPSTKRSGAC